jgi:hypothetical protein
MHFAKEQRATASAHKRTIAVHREGVAEAEFGT